MHTPFQLQIKALQTCKSLFQTHDASGSTSSVHFIHRLGPVVVGMVEGGGGREGKLEVMVEASQVLEGLLEATPQDKSEFDYTVEQ